MINYSSKKDVLNMMKKNYKTEYIQPVDMFPGTTHVETVCLLTHS